VVSDQQRQLHAGEEFPGLDQGGVQGMAVQVEPVKPKLKRLEF
jgi:hypothetical protein